MRYCDKNLTVKIVDKTLARPLTPTMTRWFNPVVVDKSSLDTLLAEAYSDIADLEREIAKLRTVVEYLQMKGASTGAEGHDSSTGTPTTSTGKKVKDLVREFVSRAEEPFTADDVLSYVHESDSNAKKNTIQAILSRAKADGQLVGDGRGNYERVRTQAEFELPSAPEPQGEKIVEEPLNGVGAINPRGFRLPAPPRR